MLFFLKATIGFGCATKLLCVYILFHHNVKKTSTQRWECNKVNNFCCFIKDIPKWNWHLVYVFVYCKWVVGKNTMTTSIVSCHCLDLCTGSNGSTQHGFCIISANGNQMQKANTNVLVLLWNHFDHPDPSKGLLGFAGIYMDYILRTSFKKGIHKILKVIKDMWTVGRTIFIWFWQKL